MINKILIANRGEIAVRIIQTAKKMGIKTVAVYSEADKQSLHTLEADECFFIGPAPSKDSYLRMDVIIDIAKKSGADAIHPGYGFLSENYEFVNRLEKEGIVFIGPPASAMQQMGSKIEAKQLARKMNVPLVPGTDEAIQSVEEAKTIASKTGFPLLIKASAGGGGKGMRRVNKLEELESQMKSASSEAMSSFGDGSVFIEKLVLNPRHIEVQIICDKFGNGLYLFERECSVQRRHQKIIEEAPSSCLNPSQRKNIGEDALRLALACNYVGAGTVEFLVDDQFNHYFLEMNTRLQVEHPVTEMITGLDLVQMQIDIADGKALTTRQEDLKINGHSIELRICAEDPLNSFLPSIGTLNKFRAAVGPHIRLDSGYTESQSISIYYDPLIAKLIVHGRDRNDAIQKLKSAISSFTIEGIETTLDYGYFVLNHQDFISGFFDTGFVEKNIEAYLSVTNNKELDEAFAKLAFHTYINEISKLPASKSESGHWYKSRKQL